MARAASRTAISTLWCANASDGIVTAQPYMNRGKQLKDLKGKHGAPFGETIMENATEGR